MIKLPKYDLNRQKAIIDAQNKVGSYTDYLNDVLKPAIERGNWDELESLDIGFTVTGRSLGKVSDNNAWRKLQSFFEPNTTKQYTLDFTFDNKTIERNLRNQLKSLALKMIWLSPRSHSFSAICDAIHGLKKHTTPLINEGYNSFEHLDFDRLEAWILTSFTDIDYEREKIYSSINKLYIESEGLPFKVALKKRLKASDFGLSLKEAEQHTVIPQRLYYIGLQASKDLINELHSIRDELGALSDYIATYRNKIYQGYAQYLSSDESKRKNGRQKWYLASRKQSDKKNNRAFTKAFLILESPSKANIVELLYKYNPVIQPHYADLFHPDRTLQIGTRRVKGYRDAIKLFKMLNGGCLWALISRTGMRSDEVFRLHTANGYTKESISKQTIHIIHTDLSKTVRGSQSKQDEFITTEIGGRAYEILQALHEPLKKRHPDSQTFFHSGTEGCSSINKAQLGKHAKNWFERTLGQRLTLTNDDVIDLKISDPNLSFNVGGDYEFSCHQLRRSFAYYLIGYELCNFPQLKQQFSHVSMAMTRHYAMNASKFQKIRKQKQNLAHTIGEERTLQQAQVYLSIYQKLANKERVAGGKGKEFAKSMLKAEHNLFKDKVDNDMLSLNYWKKQILKQKRHIHAVAPGIYCTSTGCSLRTQVNLLECVDCKNDYIVDAVFAEAKRKEAEIHMLWDIEHDELTPQTASEVYIKITAAERIMKDLDISYEPVVIPQEVQDLLIPCGVNT
ncbi:Tyrosine-type recombinase/integrase [Vibrio crassostreae]|nr:Tyrosine-type recombinase/integrase [Vibrio crassostreae]CAK3907538.1 Tyrosine-type recombinase/integrase [Vibrio crassostreae]